MIQLLFVVLFAEAAAAAALLLLAAEAGPLRELAMRGVEQAKTGKGPAAVKTLACVLSAILVSSVAAILKIHGRGLKLGTLSPMDQVLWRTHLLVATLIGNILFLAFVISQLHHFHQNLILLRATANTFREEAQKLQMDHQSILEKEERSSSEIKKLQDDNAELKEVMKKLKSESEDRERRALDAEAHVNALQKQSEELLLEYDRVLEDNQILQRQLHY